MFGQKSNSFSFGSSTTGAPASGGLFAPATGTSTGSGLFAPAASATGAPASGGLFGTASSQPKPFGFGTAIQQQQQAPQAIGGPFGLNTAQNQNQPAQGGGLFGAQPQQQQQPQQQTGGLFGTPQQQPGGLFGTQSQPQQQSTSLFGRATQNQPLSGGLFNAQPQQTQGAFGTLNQPQQSQPSGGLFGARPQQQNAFGQSQQQTQPQRPFDQTLRFGQSQQGEAQGPNGATPLWEEGKGLGVYRSIPAQIGIIKEKWDPAALNSPLRTYLFQHVGDEAEALRYRPGPGEDENKWEEAVQKRPGPTWVPLLVRGFFELGKKAQIQMEAIQRCNMMLQEINTSLDIQLDTHRQKVTARLAECKRRHQAVSQRTLALAVKVQILRNRGYVMDNAEEELKSKLEKMERVVFDPSLNAREQEIWARMLGIRERAKRLKAEMDKIAPQVQNEEPLLDEDTVKAAKDTLEAYDTQLGHLQKEMQLVQQEFEDWEKLAQGREEDRPRRR